MRHSQPIWTYRFRVERDVDELRQMIGMETEIAAFNDLGLADAVFNLAVALYPDQKLYLMQGTRVVRKHP